MLARRFRSFDRALFLFIFLFCATGRNPQFIFFCLLKRSEWGKWGNRLFYGSVLCNQRRHCIPHWCRKKERKKKTCCCCWWDLEKIEWPSKCKRWRLFFLQWGVCVYIVKGAKKDWLLVSFVTAQQDVLIAQWLNYASTSLIHLFRAALCTHVQLASGNTFHAQYLVLDKRGRRIDAFFCHWFIDRTVKMPQTP